MRKGSKRHIKPIKGPKLPLTDVHARDLALQAHVAATKLDTAQGINSYINILSVCAIAMKHGGTLDLHSERIIQTSIKMLDECIKSGRLQDKADVYLKRTACFITDWVQDGQVTYASLLYAKAAMKVADERVIELTQ